MQNNTQTIAWVAISLFVALVVIFLALPFLKEGAISIMERFASVTTGGDWNPPASWGGGN